MPEDKKLEKIEKILTLVDEEYVKPAEMADILTVVVDKMEGGDKQSLDAVAKLTEDTDSEIARLDDSIVGVKDTIKKTQNDFNDKIAKVKTIKGEKGDKGDRGDKGDSIKGDSGKDGKDGKDGKEITPEAVVEKINDSKKLIKKSKVEGLEDIERIAKLNAQPAAITTSFINGRRAKNLNFTGATVTYRDDTANVDIVASGGTSDHSLLSNLDYASAGHTGFEPAKGADDNFVTDAEKTKLSNISITQAVDLDALETASHAAVTLAGEDFLSLSGQQITANPIDLDNLSATGTPSGSNFLRGDNTWATPAGSGDISNGGNTTGAAIVIGTNDNYGVQIETGGIPRITVNHGASGGVVVTGQSSGGGENLFSVSDGATDQLTLDDFGNLGVDGDVTATGDVTGANLSGTNTGDQVGDGVTITGAGTVGDPFVALTVGGGLTLLTATGTIDDSNVDFTFVSEPTLLVINGGVYQKTGGAITWTWLVATATLSVPVGDGGSIFGIA